MNFVYPVHLSFAGMDHLDAQKLRGVNRSRTEVTVGMEARSRNQRFVLVLVVVLVLIVAPKLFIEPGQKPLFEAFERERPRIVNNFARISRRNSAAEQSCRNLSATLLDQ
jgi:hypothetical protein